MSARRGRLLAVGLPLAVGALVAAIDRGVAAPLAFGSAFSCLFVARHYRSWPRSRRMAAGALLASIAMLLAWPVARVIAENVADPGEWDFLGFWLHSQTALERENFYDPIHAQKRAAGMLVSDAFRTEIIDVGFWYPPQSMLLFWPLGLFSRSTSLSLWYGVNVVVLIGAVLLLCRTFFDELGALPLLSTLGLVLACYGTLSTVTFAQTTFVCLLFVAAAGLEPDRIRAGVFAALAFFVKPFSGLLLVPALFARERRTVAGGVLAVLASSAVALVAFGGEVFLRYFSLDHAANKPSWIFIESTNQSLLGLMLRVLDASCEGSACVRFPPFIGAFVVGLVVTAWLTTRIVREAALAKAFWLAFALLFYPVSQVFYSVLLVWVALVSFRRGEPGKIGWLIHATVLGLMFALARAEDGRFTVLAYGLAWLLLLAQAARVAFPIHAKRLELA
jgi:hypothetical protein